jgi:uncharacterized protein YdcH (DUF465 family)
VDQRELDLIAKLADAHPDVKSLWDEHVLFKKQLEKLESKPYRSPGEEQELRLLKKQKLEGKTKLVDLLHRYGS